MSILGFGGKEKTNLPAIMTTEITFQRSVVHKCAQADFVLINECLGIADHPDAAAIAEEFLTTEDGKALVRGLKGYMLFALGKTL